ncbi:MAG: hypothetical protein GTO63_14100 [Anaerolineae bacterium]|nr:hypothetical protein [Anaerolineae bacterium]NIN95978.1 hypothetical protein [Anaerolineae bacterium]NIQ78941.1 hypothetical protein [Anaerolineae bacterium]
MESWGFVCYVIFMVLLALAVLFVVGILGLVFLGLLAALPLQAVLAIASRRWEQRRRTTAMLGVGMAAAGLLFLSGLARLNWLLHPTNWLYDPWCSEAPYSNPPPTFQESDLTGAWQARYNDGVDRLVFRADGTFKQVYEERVANVVRLYAYETPWNDWRVERLSDGRVRIHLEGARYYRDGVSMAEEGGPGQRFGGCFYDPTTNEEVYVRGRLVLNVRSDPSGKIILLHMWPYPGRGFVMKGCEEEMFRRLGSE